MMLIVCSAFIRLLVIDSFVDGLHCVNETILICDLTKVELGRETREAEL